MAMWSRARPGGRGFFCRPGAVRGVWDGWGYLSRRCFSS